VPAQQRQQEREIISARRRKHRNVARSARVRVSISNAEAAHSRHPFQSVPLRLQPHQALLQRETQQNGRKTGTRSAFPWFESYQAASASL